MAARKTGVKDATNDAAPAIQLDRPYKADIEVKGLADLLFHRYSVEAVEEKGQGKGTRKSKTDDVDSYVYRCTDGTLGLPTLNFCRALAIAAKSFKDPRSARKSAHDLFNAGIVPQVDREMTSFGVVDWDYLDRRRAVVNNGAITRVRPALLRGWTATFHIEVLAAAHIDPDTLKRVVDEAGMFQGLGDYRPTFGRFKVMGFYTYQ